MTTQAGERRDLPVLARKDSVHAQVLRPRGVHRAARANAAGDVAFRLVRRRRHPEAVISRLNGWPARTPINASPPPSQTPAHDSGPSWIATPSMSGVLIPFLPPVYPGARHVHHATDRRVRRPAIPRQHRHGYAAGIHCGLPTGETLPASELTATLSCGDRSRAANRPISARLEPARRLRGVGHWFLAYTFPSR